MIDKSVIVLDSSQIEAFLTCPYLWKQEYKERLIPLAAALKPSTPMDMGTYGHKLLEIIYKERAKGNSQTALDMAFSYDIDKETCRCSHGREKHPFLCCQSTGCECQQFEAVEFPLTKPDRDFVRQRVLEYTFAENSYLPQLVAKSPGHVEVGFSHKLYEDLDRIFVLEGRIDIIGQIANNCDGWADHKFQTRERDLYLKSIQFRNYAFVTKLPIGTVNYIRFAKKVEKGKTFKRDIISFSRQEMSAWEEELINIFHHVESFVTRQERQDYEQLDRNWASCSGKFGYPCDYTKLCENYQIPSLVQILKDTEFKKRPEWRPW